MIAWIVENDGLAWIDPRTGRDEDLQTLAFVRAPGGGRALGRVAWWPRTAPAAFVPAGRRVAVLVDDLDHRPGDPVRFALVARDLTAGDGAGPRAPAPVRIELRDPLGRTRDSVRLVPDARGAAWGVQDVVRRRLPVAVVCSAEGPEGKVHGL